MLVDVGEFVKFGSYSENGKSFTVTSNSVCVSIDPLIGVSNNDIDENILDVYNFDTETYTRMCKSTLLKVIQGV